MTMRWAVEDYGLNALELESKYQKYDYHYKYTRQIWKKMETPMPYWEWVEDCLYVERGELDCANQGYYL